jgi:hypothetical protein
VDWRPDPVAAGSGGLEVGRRPEAAARLRWPSADDDGSSEDTPWSSGDSDGGSRAVAAAVALTLVLRGASAAAAVAASAAAGVVTEALASLPVWSLALSYADALARTRFAAACSDDRQAVAPPPPLLITVAQLHTTVLLRVAALEGTHALAPRRRTVWSV